MRPIRLVAGGDVNLGRAAGQAILANPAYDPFQRLGAAWSRADARFVNLESPLSDQGGETQSPFNRLVFSGPPEGASVLSRAGVSVVSTANNHAWDYGRRSLFETLRSLDAARVRHAGTGRDLEEAYRPALLELGGFKIAVFAVTHVWNHGSFFRHHGRKHVAWAAFPRLRRALQKARAENDLVLVSYHGGAEYVDQPNFRTRAFVNAVMRAGADVLVGHHPHVTQGVHWFPAGPALYSLGNLVFDTRPDQPWTRFGALLEIELSPDRAHRYALCTYRVVGHEPAALVGHEQAPERERFLSRLRRLSMWKSGAVIGPADALGCAELRRAQPTKPLPVQPDPARARPKSRSLALR